MITYNPFDNARTIQVGINADTGYFIHITPRDAGEDSTYICTGGCTATALILQANYVGHFDYHTTLFNDADATASFIREAAAVGFVA